MKKSSKWVGLNRWMFTSSLITLTAPLILSIFTGPFGFIVIGLSVAFLIFPAAAVTVTIWALNRKMVLGGFHVFMILTGGWLLIIVSAAGIATLITPNPLNTTSLVGSPFLSWLLIYIPFATLGVLSGVILSVRSRRLHNETV